MAARMMSLKQPSWIYCTCLWLAALAVVNAQEVLQPKPDKLQILKRDTKGNTKYPVPDPKTTVPDPKTTVTDPKTRDDFLQYSLRLTLDLNTAHKDLRLSDGNRKITNTYNDQPYPDHPDRFKYYDQVLCRESVSGRSYWEVECIEGLGSSISVSYQSICRGMDDECEFGANDQSWSLSTYLDSYSFTHNNIKTALRVEPISSSGYNRVGVYVDHRAGTLSFYSVSGDTMRLIHTVQTTFTKPLYPGIWVGSGASVKLL